MKNSKSKLRKLPVAHFDVTTPWFHRLLQYDVMTMKAGGGTLPLLREPGILHSSSIALIELLFIPAFTEVVLPYNVKRPTKFKSNDVFIPRSACLLDKYVILGANYVTKTKDYLVPVRLVNFTTKSICIAVGTIVADLVPIVKENISYINAYSLYCISEGVDESTTDDDVFSLIEQLHLNDLNLSDVEREAVIEVIRRRQSAFSLSKHDLGKTNILTHSIDTGDVTPIRQHLRRMSEENKRKVEMRLLAIEVYSILMLCRLD